MQKNKMLENIKYNWYIYLIILDLFLANLFKLPPLISLCLKIVSGIFLIKKYFERSFSKKKLLIFSCFIIIVIINFNQLKLNIMYIYLFINVKDKLKDIEISILKLLIFLLILNIFLIEIGLIKNQITFYGGRVRQNYGFMNANAISLFYFYIIVYLWKYKKLYLKMLASLLSYTIYIVTDSRTQFLGFLILISVVFIFKKFFKKSKLYTIKKYIIIMILILNYIYLLLGINANKFFEINKLLSYRLSYVRKAFLDLDILEFLIGSNKGIKFPIDNSLLIANYSMGFILGNIIYIYIYISILKNIKKYSDYRYGLVVACLLMGIFESFLLRLSLPVSILFYTTVFKNKKMEVKYESYFKYTRKNNSKKGQNIIS